MTMELGNFKIGLAGPGLVDIKGKFDHAFGNVIVDLDIDLVKIAAELKAKIPNPLAQRAIDGFLKAIS